MRFTLLVRMTAVAALLLSCAAGPSGPSSREIERDLEQGNTAAAEEKLEKARAANPRDFETRIQLAQLYYRMAREALEEDREADYTRQIGLAHEELLAAVDINPRAAEAHLWMGVILAYQGQLDSALSSFKNARRLEPRLWVHTTNLAEIWVYKGNMARARTLLDRSRKIGASRPVVELVEMLASWKQGDLVDARDLFDGLHSMNPEVLQTWNIAKVDDPPETFQEFTTFCCGHIACGPYMEGACKEMDLEVAKRELEAETIRREMEVELERRRRLKEIYDRHRDIEIEVDEP